MGKDSSIEVAVSFLEHHTDGKAIRVTDGTLDDKGKVRTYWLPVSQIEYDGDPSVGDVIEITMPEWLALKKGLI